ncbi:MAG: dihydrofolate reductase [Bacillota bacterium]|nr:dihydrofolate reductase [Bacillota bacterium]
MLNIIVAVAKNLAIGRDNRLLWHLPNDLKYFKEITSGNTIIMGRKTFNSLPKILPNRHHIVLTRDKNFKVEDDRVTIFNSVEGLISSLDDSKQYFIIGGGEIYKQLLPFANRIYLTTVDKEYDADTYFPALNLNQWKVIDEKQGIIDEKNTLVHKFSILDRIS